MNSLKLMNMRDNTLNGFDWGSIDWGAIGQATGNIVSGWIDDEQGNTGVNYYPNGNTNNTTTPPPVTEKDNTMLYVGLGVGALALLYLFNNSGNSPRGRR